MRVAVPPETSHHWLPALKRGLREPVTWVLFAVGLASGLPLGWAWYNLPAWSGFAPHVPPMSLPFIGAYAAYTLVALLGLILAPLLDRRDAPLFRRLGHRRGWVAFTLAAALALTLCFVAFALVLPGAAAAGAVFVYSGVALVAVALLVVTIDAFRIEIRPGRAQAIAFGAQFLGAWVAQFTGLLAGSWDRLSLPFAGVCALTLALALWAVMRLPEAEPPRAAARAPECPVAQEPVPFGTPATWLRALVAPWVAFFARHGRAAALLLAALGFSALAVSAIHFLGVQGFLTDLAASRPDEFIERFKQAQGMIGAFAYAFVFAGILAGIVVALSHPPARAFELLQQAIIAIALLALVLRLAAGTSPVAAAVLMAAAWVLFEAHFIIMAVVAAALTARPYTAGQITMIGVFLGVFWLTSGACHQLVAALGTIWLTVMALAAAIAALVCMRVARRLPRRRAESGAISAAHASD